MANTPEFERNDELEQQLWEFAYGLLSEEEADAIQRRLDDDPEVADRWTIVKEQLDTLAVATRFTGRGVRLEIPVGENGTAEDDLPKAEVLVERKDADQNSGMRERGTIGFTLRSTVHWLTPLASAAVLLFAVLRGSPAIVLPVGDESRREVVLSPEPLKVVVPRVVDADTAHYVSFYSPQKPLRITVESESGEVMYDESWLADKGTFQLPEVKEGKSLLLKAESTNWGVRARIAVDEVENLRGPSMIEEGMANENAPEEDLALNRLLDESVAVDAFRLASPENENAVASRLDSKQSDLSKLKVAVTRDRVAPGTQAQLAYRIENEPHTVEALAVHLSWGDKTLPPFEVKLSREDETDTSYQGILSFEVPAQVLGPARVFVLGQNSRGRVLEATAAIPVEPNLVRTETWADSGVVVPGLMQRFRIETVDGSRHGVATRGHVIDQLGKEIVAFATDNNGRGYFDFTPQSGEVYHLKSQDGYLLSDELQVADKGFVALAADELNFVQVDSTVRLNVVSTKPADIVVSLFGRNDDDRVGVSHQGVRVNEGDNQLQLPLPKSLTKVHRVVGASKDGNVNFDKTLTDRDLVPQQYGGVLEDGRMLYRRRDRLSASAQKPPPKDIGGFGGMSDFVLPSDLEESEVLIEVDSLSAQVIIGTFATVVDSNDRTAAPPVVSRINNAWIVASALALLGWAFCVALLRMSRPRVWGPTMAMCGVALISVVQDLGQQTVLVAVIDSDHDSKAVGDNGGPRGAKSILPNTDKPLAELEQGKSDADDTIRLSEDENRSSAVLDVDEGLPAVRENKLAMAVQPPPQKNAVVDNPEFPEVTKSLGGGLGGGGGFGSGTDVPAVEVSRYWMRYLRPIGVGRVLQEQGNRLLDLETRPLARLSIGDRLNTPLTVRNFDRKNAQELGLDLELDRSVVGGIDSKMMLLKANGVEERQMKLWAVEAAIGELHLTLHSPAGRNVWFGTVEVVDPRPPVTKWIGGIDVADLQLATEQSVPTRGVLWCYPSKAAEIEAVSSSLREQPVVTWDQLATLISSQSLHLRWLEDAEVADVDAILAAKETLREWLARAALPIWQAALPDLERASEHTRIVVDSAMAAALRDAKVVANVDQVTYSDWQKKLDRDSLFQNAQSDPQDVSARAYAIWQWSDLFDEPTKLIARQKISEWAVDLQSAYLASLASLMTDQSDDQLQELILQGQLESGEIAALHPTASGSDGRSRSIEATALAALALYKLDRQHECDRALNWLRTQRQDHRFGSAHATYLVFLALSQDSQNTRVDQQKMQLVSDFRFANDISTFTCDAPTGDGNQPIGIAFMIPRSDQCQGVRFRFPQQPSVPMELRLWRFVDGPLSTDDALSIEVRPARPRIDRDTQLVVSVTAANSAEEDAERVLVTVPLPAGFEVADQGLVEQQEEGKFDGYSIDPLHVLFFWEKIPAESKVECQLQLNAAATGKMNAVAPSLHRLADPERRAWDKSWTVVVE